MRVAFSVETAPLKFKYKLPSTETTPAAVLDTDETAETRVVISVEIAELKLELTEVNVDAAELTDEERLCTPEARVEDSETNAADMV